MAKRGSHQRPSFCLIVLIVMMVEPIKWSFAFPFYEKAALTLLSTPRYTPTITPWWSERGGPTRSHPEHGSETPQRRRYCTRKGVGK